MNKILANLFLFLSVLFTACSSDEPAIDEGGKTDGEATQAYMNIRIGMANIPGTRANENDRDGGTEDGTDNEQSVSSLLLKFYDANGKFYGYGDPVTDLTVKRPTGASAGSTGHNVEGYIGATVVLTINEDDDKPSYVVAYLNCGTKKTPEPDMTDLSETVSTLCDEDNTDFFMTSSNFFEKGYQTSVSSDKFYYSAEEAKDAAENKENWVNIYVERLAAKVSVTNNATTNSTNVPVESNGYKLTFTYTGYNLGGINTYSYLIKNIDGFDENTPWGGWNASNLYRSYWAKDVNYTYAIPTDGNVLGYKPYNNSNTNLTALYCAENTFDEVNESVKNPYLVQPFVYVFGYYTVTKDGTEVDDPALYEYAGKIYTSSDIINVIQNSIGSFLFTKVTTGEGENTQDVYTPIILTSENVDIISCKNQDIHTDANDASRIMLKLKESYTIPENAYVKQVDESGESSYVSASENNINDWLAKQKITVNGFKKTDENRYPVYFPVLVEHLNWNTDGPGEVGAYGIVRNHVYKIEISSIKNLGVGIFDPTVDIIPHEKVKKMYLAAKINILSWKIVNQSVDL